MPKNRRKGSAENTTMRETILISQDLSLRGNSLFFQIDSSNCIDNDEND